MMQLWACMMLCLCVTAQSIPRLDFTYHNYTELTKYLHNVAKAYPDVVTLYSIGTSVKNMTLWVMKLTTASETKLGVPSVKLIGNIHGNEPAGREVLLHLIEFFVVNYKNDEAVRWLLDNTRIHILPCLNPDGFNISLQGRCEQGPGRENAKHIDLNRSFPDYFQKNTVPEQVETAAVKNWLQNNTFVLSASLHGGALVANYPYENVKESTVMMMREDIRPPSISPDDDVFRHLAMKYSRTHPSMHRGEPCTSGEKGFPNGITNGAAWYSLTGGMQDYNYVFHGCMEITLEISCCKYPVASQLPKLWTDNKEPLFTYINEVHRGVRGLVVDSISGQPIKNVSLKISGREISFRTSPKGEFWRILLPGDYELEVSAPNYVSKKVSFTVPEIKNLQYLTPKWLNVTMSTFEQQETTAPVVSHTTEARITPTVQEMTTEYTSELTTVVTNNLEVYDRHIDSNYEKMTGTGSGFRGDVWINVTIVTALLSISVTLLTYVSM